MTEHQTEDIDVTTPEAELEAVETEAVEAEATEAEAPAAEATEADAPEAEATEAETPEAEAVEAEDAEVEGTPVVRHTLNAGAHHLAQTVGRRKQAIVRVRDRERRAH